MKEWLLTHGLSSHMISTFVLVLGVLVLRRIILYRVQKSDKLALDVKRRWIVQIRNSSLLIIIISVALIWGSELRTFAVSIIAIAVAIVLATKELIMCLSGYVVKGISHSFSIGDRIEINGIRGLKLASSPKYSENNYWMNLIKIDTENEPSAKQKRKRNENAESL